MNRAWRLLLKYDILESDSYACRYNVDVAKDTWHVFVIAFDKPFVVEVVLQANTKFNATVGIIVTFNSDAAFCVCLAVNKGNSISDQWINLEIICKIEHILGIQTNREV